MAGTLPKGKTQFVSDTGTPLAAGTVAFYVPGTTTSKDTYQDNLAVTKNTNPVNLDAAGRAIIFGTGSYRQIVKDAQGNTIWDQVVDAPAPITDVSGISATVLAAVLTTISAPTGATLVGEASGGTVQTKLNTLTTGVANAASAAAAASATANVLPSNPAALPYEVTAISGGIGTGTGGTNGTYAGGVSGGPTGFQWTYTIASNTLASYAILNPGISTSNAAPTLSFPLGGLVAPTIPTATVGTIPVNRTFWAVTADSQYAALWQNVATVLTAVAGPDTNQVKEPLGNVLLGANKIAIKFGAGKAGKGSLLQRSTFQKGYYMSGLGAVTAGTNFMIVGPMPCSETQGIGATIGEFGTTRTLAFFDKDGNIVCNNLALFTATFVTGSPNFTITAWRGSSGGVAPPGMPLVGGGPNVTDPLMSGMGLFDVTNNNNAVIPAGAYADAVSPIPYATSYTYTMKGPGGVAINAVSSASVNVTTGGFLPGVPIIPPMGFNITQAYASMTYAGSYGIQNQIDDIDFFPVNIAVAAEIKTYAGSSVNTYLRSGHDAGVGFGDIENSRPLMGRNAGAMGNSALLHEAWSKAFTLETRCKLQYRGGLGGRQAHQYLDGIATSGTGSANWNGLNPTNLNGAAVAADFNGLELLIIGTCGPNEQGYSNGTTGLIANGGGAAGGGQQPYTIGAITETGAGLAANVTANGTTALVVNSIASQSALLPTLVGLKFPTTASFGLAGRTIASQSTGTTGGVGNYVLDSAAGVGSGTGAMMIGSYYGTMNWLLGQLLAYNNTNAGKMLPVLVSPAPRYDLTSANGGVTGTTFDLANPGNPLCASTGHRLSAFADANIALGNLWKIPVVDIFYKGGFSPFWEPKYYNTDNLHFNDGTLPGLQGNPVGDRAMAKQIATTVNGLFGIA